MSLAESPIIISIWRTPLKSRFSRERHPANAMNDRRLTFAAVRGATSETPLRLSSDHADGIP